MIQFSLVPDNGDTYTYTAGIDAKDIFLFCNVQDISIKLSNIYWRLESGIGLYPNPLDIYALQNTHTHGNYKEVECFDSESGSSILSLALYLQGPPEITLNSGPITTFSALPPDINTFNVEVLTLDVILYTNLVGTWQLPSDSSVAHSFLTIPIFHQSDEGLYMFYISNWYGEQTLAIQIQISILDSSFGEQINSTTYISLTEDSILITNTTLYCVAEDKTSPQVVWSYLHPSGTRSNLTATTNDVTTGISTLYVYSNNPGYYSCEVTTKEGTVVTHTVRMLDTTQYTESQNGDNYTYTTGIDANDTFLFCNTKDSSVQLSNIYWRRKGGLGYYINPLDVYRLRNILIHTNNEELECFDTESGDSIMSVELYIQGPPIITLNNGSISTFSLLPPSINSAAVKLLTQNVSLYANHDGKWQTPVGGFLTQRSLFFPIFRQIDNGMYNFYIRDWFGEESVVIQLNISIIESTQRFVNLKAETLDQTSLLVSWSLLETTSIFSNLIFSIYLDFNAFTLDGTTTNSFYEITQLYTDVNYTIRVESVIPYSTQIISSTIYHFLEFEVTGPTVLINNMSQSTQTSTITPTIEALPSLFTEFSIYIIIGGIFIIVILLVLVIIITVVACCLLKRRISKQNIIQNADVNATPFAIPEHANEIYEQIDNINLAYASEKGEKECTNPMDFELSALGNEAYGRIGNLNPFYSPDEFEEIDQQKGIVSRTGLSASHYDK